MCESKLCSALKLVIVGDKPVAFLAADKMCLGMVFSFGLDAAKRAVGLRSEGDGSGSYCHDVVTICVNRADWLSH